MELYFSKCGTYTVRQNCTGTAYGAGGNGFFDYPSYSGSAGSVAQGLVDMGVIGGIITDPSGAVSSYGTYLINANSNYYCLWAVLGNPSAADQQTLNNCQIAGNYSTQPEYLINYGVSNY